MAAQPNRYSTLIWRKSSHSADAGNCVEVTKSDSSLLVRDSADQFGSVLELTRTQWTGLVRRIKNEEIAGR
jgi:hypothetical protein